MSHASVLIEERGIFLGDFGYLADGSMVEQTPDGRVVFYHYTHEDRVEAIPAPNGGLFARRPVACPKPPTEFVDAYLTEGFLEPLPKWLTTSPHFGDLGMEMVRQYIGDVLLRIEVPHDFPGLYVADYAHYLECKHLNMRGHSPLQLGYDCSTGHQVTQAYVHSYIDARTYIRGHLAPLMQAVRNGQGIVIPSDYISIPEVQPLRKVNKN